MKKTLFPTLGTTVFEKSEWFETCVTLTYMKADFYLI